MLSILIVAVIGLFSYVVFANYQDSKNEERRLTIFSKDGNHAVKFSSKGSIRWGPEYYGISIDETALKNRIFFFKDNSWSPNSIYFVAEELYNIGKGEAELKTRLVLFNIGENKYSNINFNTACAWVNNIKFSDNKFICKYIESYNPEKERVIEVNINDIKNWENYL